MMRIELEIQLAMQQHQPQTVIDLLNEEFQADLERSRELGCNASPTPKPFVPHWAPADSLTILVGEAENAWHAGHVNDVLVLEGGGDAGAILVGTDTGGVWVIQQPESTTSPRARPLSDGWSLPSVDIRCLAFGPDGPEHVYAGTATGIVEADPSAPFPLDGWRDIAGSIAFGRVHRIVVLAQPRKIVVASDRGVHWADIPARGGAYAWQNTVGLLGVCTGAARAPDDKVVVAVPLTGIFVGQWKPTGLIFERRPLPRDPASLFPTEAVMGWTSLASCATDRSLIYASMALNSPPFEGTLLGVFRSEDGGGSWNLCNMTVRRNSTDKLGTMQTPLVPRAGNQGNDWNNVIAVSPADPNVVVLGWRSGPIISDSGGRNPWAMPAQDADDNGGHQADKTRHVHGDLHALAFDSTGSRLYVGSDGGVIATDDFGHTFTSLYNRELLNLQFDRDHFAADWDTDGMLPGEGLVAGGTQDNGNIVAVVGGNETGWREVDGGDGGQNMFAFSTALLRFYNTEPRVRWADWDASFRFMRNGKGGACEYRDGDGNEQRPDGVVSVRIPKPPTTNIDLCGLKGPLLTAIRDIQFERNNRSMGAIAADGRDLYGLFGNFQTHDIWWEYLNSLPDSTGSVSAIASAHGTSLLVGTDSCTMFRMRAPSFKPEQLVCPQPFKQTPAVRRIAAISDTLGYAFYNSGLISERGIVLRYDGQKWLAVSGVGLPQAPFVTMETDPTTIPPTLFVALGDRVVLSDNGGSSWRDASHGLPRHAHCSDLRFARGLDGGHYLYLSTYGRSVWRAPINRRPL
jgi:hypothetical protein